MKGIFTLATVAGVAALVGLQSTSSDDRAQRPLVTSQRTDVSHASARRSEAAPFEVRCDYGDAYALPTPPDKLITVRLSIHVFSPDVTPQQIDDEIAAAQCVLINHNVDLCVDYEFVANRRFALLSSETEVARMKRQFAEDPQNILNVYVTDLRAGLTERLAPAPSERASESTPGIIINGRALRVHGRSLPDAIARCLALPLDDIRRRERRTKG